MIIPIIRWIHFIIISLLLSVSLIAPNHSAWASNNESPHLSNAEANLILHQQQMEKHYLEMQQRQLDLRQKYQTIIQNTNAKQTTFSLFMVNNQPSIPIYTVDDLINVAQDMSASYILMSDLDLSCIPDWTPLVGPSGELFMGTFDGNGYSISNLRSTHGGLFYGNYGGIIKNIKLVDVNIESTGQHSHDVGAIAGFSEQGLITNCSVTGRIVAYYDASGITAYVSQTTISSCKVDAIIISSGSGGDAGGITSYNDTSGIIENCSTAGEITSIGYGSEAGGIAANSTGNITACSSSATCRSSRDTGGIAGCFYYGEMKECIATGAILASSGCAGGIVGSFWDGTMNNCAAAGDVTAKYDAGGIAGCFWNGSMNNCNATGVINGGSNAGGIAGCFWDGSMSGCSATGSVSGDCAGGIAGGFWDANMENCYATGSIHGRDAGGLVEWANNVSLNNCYATGSVNSTRFAGGFIDYSYGNTVISNCYSTGNVVVSGSDRINYAGGFIGLHDESCLISNCWSTGNVRYSGSNPQGAAGGFAGYCCGSVQDCKAYGSVQGVVYTGGMFGFCGPDDTNPAQSITRCYSFGNVTGQGGYTGGFVGTNTSTAISQCCALGNVTGQGNYTGGFAGEDKGASTDCYAWGDVTGVDYVGGYLGGGASRLTNVYSKGYVTGTGANVGGLIGDLNFINNGGIATSCYYDMQTSGHSDTGKGTPQTTTAMQRQGTFTGWDFTNVWKIHEGSSYPYFVELNTIPKENLGIRPYCLYGKSSVNLSTGNFIFAQTDLSIPSVGPSLNFTRFYNSQDDYTGAQGKGWTNNYNVYLTINQDNSISVAYDDGHVYTFTSDGTNYVSPAGCFETLTAGPESGYTLTFKDQISYIFNDIGQLTSITDQNNNTLTLTYTGGLLTLVSEPAGRTLSFNYDQNNRLTGVTDSAGRTVAYTYDENGNLAAVQDVLGNVTRYHYDVMGLAGVIAPDDNTLLHNTYDENGKVIRQTDGSGNTTRFSYDPYNRRTTMTDALGNAITAIYDEKYRCTNITYPGNITKTFTFDANNCLASITDPLNHTTRYTYDNNGNLLTVTDPAGNTTTMEYDDHNNLLLVENALGKQSTFTYDPNGNLIKTTDPLGNETTYNYYESGLLLSITTPDTGLGAGTTIYTYQNGLPQTVTDPAENTTTYSYNAAGQPVAITDNAGKTSHLTYDNAGNLLTVADPLGNTTSYTYDWRGNVITEIDARGNATSYTYNNNGLLTSKIDALNNETAYEYDAENRLVKVIDPRGGTTRLNYDALGLLVSVTNPLGETITSQYDAAGNLIGRIDASGKQVLTVTYDELYNPKKLTNALGNSVSFDEYDEISRLTRFTGPGGNITRFEYDGLNRLKTTIDAQSGRGSQEFDARGNRTAMVDPNNNQISFSYDNADRLTARTTAASGNVILTYNNRNLIAQKINARGQIVVYEYDDAGRIISASYPDGTVTYTYDQNGNLLTATDRTGTIEYQYDALNRLVEYKDTRNNVIQYAYDATGNLSRLTYPGGRQVQYQYDQANRLVQVTDWADRVTAYEYDLNGRLVKTVHPNGAQTTRTYDEAGRLSQLKDEDAGGNIISQYDYTYDAAGNIIQEESSNETVPFTMDDAALTYAEDNRLATYNGQTVRYDADGNMTTGPLAGTMVNFTYDARNRLTGAGNTTYTYDAGNNRIQVSSGAHQTSYTVNPNASLSQVLIQTDKQNHQNFYIYGLGLIGHEDEEGVYHNYHFDYRGSTIALTDESGNITDRFQYAPYGELVYRSGNTATPFLYVGRYGVMTDESDLYYMRARYYNPVAKRFLSPDTIIGQISNPQSQNRYMYCEGNPVIYVDPAGYNPNLIQKMIDKAPGLVQSLGNYGSKVLEVIKTEGPIIINNTKNAIENAAKVAPELIDQLKSHVQFSGVTSVEIVGKVEVPEGLIPGTCSFGNAMHEKIAYWIRDDQYIESEFDLRVKPGEKGIDITVLDNQNNLDFLHAEIKPMSVSGLKRFKSQMVKWDLPYSKTVVFSYDYDGNIYLIKLIDESILGW